VGSDEAREAVSELRELVVQTLQDVRRLAVELRPSALDDFGLVPAIERLADTFRERSGMEVDVEVQIGDERLPGPVETTLYRIVQEALTNIAKHAGARHVSIILARKNGAIAALVEDDGAGFDASAEADGGLGLVGMRERVRLVGGVLRIESTPGSGTTLLAEVPVQ
jgi:signal transduction histidine kinase